jgi:hypothetical protein
MWLPLEIAQIFLTVTRAAITALCHTVREWRAWMPKTQPVELDDIEQGLHVRSELIPKTGLVANVGEGIVPAK